MGKTAKKRGNEAVARAYLDYLYTDEGQKIAARHYYRPWTKSALTAAAVKFPDLKLFTIDEAFGGWAKAQKTHFSDGGVFDQIYKP